MMQEAVCFSVVLKSIWVGELAQLRKKWLNCETKCTTAKKWHNCEIVRSNHIQKKWHNCKTKCTSAKKSTTAKHIYCSCTFFGNNHFSLSLHLIPCPTPCRNGRQDEVMVHTIHHRRPGATYVLFLLLLFSLAFQEKNVRNYRFLSGRRSR